MKKRLVFKMVLLSSIFTLSYSFTVNRGEIFAQEDRVQLLENKDASEWLKLGQALVKKAKLQEALSFFSKAIEMKSDYAEAYLERASTYSDLKQYDKAIQDATIALSLKLKDPIDVIYAHYTRGYSYYFLKKYSKAIEDFSKLLKKQKFDDAYYFRGKSYFSLKSYNKAIKDMNLYIFISREKLLNKSPNKGRLINAYITRGFAYNELSVCPKAKADIFTACELGNSGACQMYKKFKGLC